MIALLQRVREAEVTVNNITVGQIKAGLVIFLGVFTTDKKSDLDFLVNKISGFRIFNDQDNKMNLSIFDIQGSVLVISQFTLCGDWRKGRRPSFMKAAPPEMGEKIYHQFINELGACGIPVESGKFGAMMDVKLINDGPVTFVLDSHLA